MGPKKEAPKKENAVKIPTIDEPVNSDTWRCVVVIAVERNYSDCFVLKEFMEEALTERRQEVKLINFDTFVMKILNDFANGELAFKYAYLLNFSSVFQEAAEYVKSKSEIPVPVLTKVVKALLFSLREDSLVKIEKKAAGPPDPIQAMTNRPQSLSGTDPKAKSKKDSVPVKGKKAEGEMKVRPPSAAKQDTRLLKRGEAVKGDECIDDAPPDGYFNLYVLLTGFYQAELPLELIKAGIPLHGLLCVDTSLSAMKRLPSTTFNKIQRKMSKIRADEIQMFWETFLKILWDPKSSCYFKDIIFQVYVPRKLLCEDQKFKDFIYREISYLLYDLSDYKRQHLNYLKHLKLCDVEERIGFQAGKSILKVVGIANECVSPTVVLQYIMDAICVNDEKHAPEETISSLGIDDPGEASIESRTLRSASILTKFSSVVAEPNWYQLVTDTEDSNLIDLYAGAKELDLKYNMDVRMFYYDVSENASSKDESNLSACDFSRLECEENMREALAFQGSVLGSYWRRVKVHRGAVTLSVVLDYCLYPLLAARVACPYQETSPPSKPSVYSRKGSSFELIKNLGEEMRKPHFTVTDGSRSVLRCIPFDAKDASRDFFSPPEFKIVSPEKLKASSAPEFRPALHQVVEASFISDLFPHEIPSKMTVNVFENLQKLLGEDLFSSSKDFEFVEELSREKLLQKEYEYWDRYSCVDHAYSVLDDTIFLVLHNRKDDDEFHHETFNEVLKTGVGLRDFFEYILDDESDWFKAQDELYKKNLISLGDDFSQGDAFRSFSETDFWLNDSIKYQEHVKLGSKSELKSNGKGEGEPTTGASPNRGQKRESASVREEQVSLEAEGPFDFVGYNVSDLVVQYSGLKTGFFENECNITVDLVERLYGDQNLGLHISQGSHTLHLYSYVCPRPHVLDPYAFHLVYKNGIVVAFGRRQVEILENVEKVVESKTTLKSRKSSSDLSASVVTKKISKFLQDDEFLYDMGLSYPNGLTVKTVRNVVKPCYIKQEYLAKSEDPAERSRLFLPNGDLVKMLADDRIEILKANAAILTAFGHDLTSNSDGFVLQRYEITTTEGYRRVFERGTIVSSKRFQTFQNTDVETNQTFFRRRDGTNYVLQSDGKLCVQFQDGTKICSLLFLEEPETLDSNSEAAFEKSDSEDFGCDFVVVHMEIVFEHHAYATVIYNTETQKWKILLPFESTVTVEPGGNYSVEIDERTDFEIVNEIIHMNRFSPEGELLCAATADLTVFGTEDGGRYCQMETFSGKTFVVEANSQCYILDKYRPSDRSSEDSSSNQSDKRLRLSRDNKYFVMRRDMTGLEVLHKEDVWKALTEIPEGSVVFTQEIPNSGARVFVLVSPAPRKKVRKWEVETILPSTQFVANPGRKTSSTYGRPPSWMHPFPKRKVRFAVPEEFVCRVFLETKRTELSPKAGHIECCFCEAEAAPEARHTVFEDVHEYLKRLSSDDQDILKEMYALSVATLVDEKKNRKPVNTEKLRRYLEMSARYVETQEYHKRCIRYHLVPNYFHHPAGMSWLILNGLLLRARLPEEQLAAPAAPEVPAPSAPESSTSVSDDEIEYNLSPVTDFSFSDLSYRTDFSGKTAPPLLETMGVCKCKFAAPRDVASAPLYREKICLKDSSEVCSEESLRRTCAFRGDEIEMLEKRRYESEEFSPLTFEDLICLGLV